MRLSWPPSGASPVGIDTPATPGSSTRPENRCPCVGASPCLTYDFSKLFLNHELDRVRKRNLHYKPRANRLRAEIRVVAYRSGRAVPRDLKPGTVPATRLPAASSAARAVSARWRTATWLSPAAGLRTLAANSPSWRAAPAAAACAGSPAPVGRPAP